MAVQTQKQSVPTAFLVPHAPVPGNTMAELSLIFMCLLIQDTREESVMVVTCGGGAYK